MELMITKADKKSDPKAQYLTYREFIRRILLLLGWSHKYSGVMYRILPYIHLFLCMSMIFCIFIFVRMNYDNIASLTRGLSIMTSFTIISLKMFCLIIHRKKFINLFDDLDIHFNNLLKDDNLSTIILHRVSTYRTLTGCITLALFITVLNYFMTPLITNIYNYIHHIEPDQYLFLYPSIFPWPVPFTGFIYQLHFIFESCANVSLFLITIGADSFFIYIIFLIIGQLREISYQLTHYDGSQKEYNIVKKCIAQYSKLMKHCDDLQEIYSPIILCMMATNAIVLCNLMYLIFQMKSLTIIKGMLLFTYIVTKVTQTYMYSWCGTHLTIESEDYRIAIYAANWNGNKRFMTAIVIMLQQRPLILTVYRLADVSIDIFIKILKTSLSYYFLLKTLEN